MHIENLSNRGMEYQYFMRRQKQPLASELVQGKLEAVPAEGMYLLDEYRRQALGINSPPWEGQLLYLPRRLSDYRKRRRKIGENFGVGSYSMQMMRITMQ